MKKLLLFFGFLTLSFQASAQPCSVADVMRDVAKSYGTTYKYASDYDGRLGAPTLKRHPQNDQYVFWVDNNGNTCPAAVTYAVGSCQNGKAFVRTTGCQ